MKLKSRQILRLAAFVALGLVAATASAEEVFFDPDFGFPPEPINPGDTIYVYVRLFDNNIPLTGYSLNIDVVPVESITSRAVGQVTGNPKESSFYKGENIITQGGGTLHPLSEIFDPGDGGLFVNAFSKGFTPVDLAGDGHDVFALTAWDVSMEAEGEFMLQIGEGSILTDENARPIPFTWNPVTFEVVFPEPGFLGLLALGFLALERRRR